ncbi:radical SAM protein [Proteinivorax tanatarense]|uniref:Radical SAM protein n=1 Tax=Proteinivorax tanatarense TaxID=1260629 RepID=A0AAU7VJE4_9FIRM
MNKSLLSESFSVYWYLTYKCNLKCKHCWVESSPTVDSEDKLSLSEVKNVLEQFKRANITNIAFSGGEPLLMKNIVDIINETNKHNIHYAFETNAILIDEQIIGAVNRRKYKNNEAVFIISLDGSTENYHDYLRGKGSFKKTVNQIFKLQKNNIPYSIQCVINKQNIHNVKEIIAFSKKLKPTNLTFAFLQPVGRAVSNLNNLELNKEDIVEVIKYINNASFIEDIDFTIKVKIQPAVVPSNIMTELKKSSKIEIVTNCDFPKIGILDNGDITICSLSKHSIRFGNIRKVNLKELINNEFIPMRRSYNDLNLQGICGECIFKIKCKGSCRVMAFCEDNCMNSAHPFCSELDRLNEFPDYYKVNS